VPSTVKCSSDIRSSDWACSTTNWKNCFATSASSRRFRFLVNTVTSHTGSSMFNPTNHRNSMLYSSCSVSMRSLRTVYSTCNSRARSSFSGGIDRRPSLAYMRENTCDNCVKIVSVRRRIARNGWSEGTRCSGDR